MKRFTLFFFAAVAALCSFAQTVGEHGETIDEHGIIVAPPADARLRTYEREGYYVVYGDGALYPYEVNGTIEIAECEDGTVFFKDIVSQCEYGTWVRGKRSEGEIRVPARQKLLYDPTYDANVILFRCCFTWGGDAVDNFDDIVYLVNPTANGEMLELVGNMYADDYLYNFIGAVWDDDDSVQAIGDYAVKLTWDPSLENSEYETAVVMPEGLETKTYNCHAYSYAYSDEQNRDVYVDFDVQIGYDGDDCYIQGLYYFTPEFVVKGKLKDGEVIFPQHQYLGKDGRAVDVFAVACYVGSVRDEDSEEYYEALLDRDYWSLIYNAEDDTYDGTDCVVRFARNRTYRYGNAYENIDEIFMTPKSSEGIVAVEAAAKNAPIYDLQGRKVKTAEKGLFIMDGKKVVR